MDLIEKKDKNWLDRYYYENENNGEAIRAAILSRDYHMTLTRLVVHFYLYR